MESFVIPRVQVRGDRGSFGRRAVPAVYTGTHSSFNSARDPVEINYKLDPSSTLPVGGNTLQSITTSFLSEQPPTEKCRGVPLALGCTTLAYYTSSAPLAKRILNKEQRSIFLPKARILSGDQEGAIIL